MSSSPPAAPHEPAPDPEGAAQFRHTLGRVMAMQAVALLALWWLQHRYGG